MQKLSLFVLERMMAANLTSKEVNFILYVAQYQNEFGEVQGVYYKDICEHINISYQGFYDCLSSLKEKNIITCEKNSYYDWDITILDNSFVGKENYGRGYISVHYAMLQDKKFLKLRAKAKLMALWLLREWLICRKKSGSDSYQLLKETFLGKFKELLNIGPRMARAYMGSLAPFLGIYLEDGRKYFLTFKKSAVDNGFSQENTELREHALQVACRRNRVKLPDGDKKKDIHQILSQHHPYIKRMREFNLAEIVAKSLKKINQNVKNKYKWKRYLNPALIHHYVMEELANA